MNTKGIAYQNWHYLRVMTAPPGRAESQAVGDRPLDKNSKIVFLDIDNILNRAEIFSQGGMYPPLTVADKALQEFLLLHAPQYIVEKKLVDLLISLQKDVPDIVFVIISEWRKHFTYAQLKNYLQPLHIGGMINPGTDKISGILSWWDTYAKPTLALAPTTAVILDDNILNAERRYLPDCGLTLVPDSAELDELVKQCLCMPLSVYGDFVPLRTQDIAEITARFRRP